MAGMTSDLDVLKDIPGYKAILKSVLKSQIQLLIEQLSDHTGEEAIILTASIHDGTLSHLGSNTGKGFLDGRDEIKSQFLAYCLKSHHKKKSSEARSSPYQRPQSGQSDRVTPQQGLSHKRPRLQPVSLQRAGAADSPGSSFTPPDIHRAPSQVLSANGQDSSNVNVKLESSEHSVSSTEGTNFVTTSVSLPTSIQLSHTQTSAEPGISDTSEGQNEDSFGDHGSENDDTAATSIKIEPITENEMELEITGVEPGKSSVAADSWSQVPGASSVSDGAVNETGDQTGYSLKTWSWLQNISTENDAFSKLDSLYNSGHGTLYPSDATSKQRPQTFEHISSENQQVEEESQQYGKVKRLKCHFCLKWFAGRGVLNRHLLIHTGERPWKCEHCPKTFNRKSSMRTHMIQHMNLDVDRPDRC